jgi:putative spermidine/putrescine transport system permease protein
MTKSPSTRWLSRLGIMILFLFLLAPVIVIVVVSFSADSILTFPPSGWSVRWYGELLQAPQFLAGFRVSLIVSCGAAVMAAGVAIPASLALSRGRFRGRAVIESLFLAPLLIPAIVIGLGLLLVFSPLGFKGTYTGLIVANGGLVVPYVMRTTILSLSTMDPRCEEAARTLGATPPAVFRTVTLPLIAPGVIAGVVLAFLLTFDEAVVSFFLVSSRVQTLPIAMFDYVQTRSDPLLAAVSSVLVFLSLMVVVVIERVIGLRRALS